MPSRLFPHWVYVMYTRLNGHCFSEFLKTTPDIISYNTFIVAKEEIGVVIARKYANYLEEKINIFKKWVSVSFLKVRNPMTIHLKYLDAKGQWHLYDVNTVWSETSISHHLR